MYRRRIRTTYFAAYCSRNVKTIVPANVAIDTHTWNVGIRRQGQCRKLSTWETLWIFRPLGRKAGKCSTEHRRARTIGRACGTGPCHDNGSKSA